MDKSPLENSGNGFVELISQVKGGDRIVEGDNRKKLSV